jgi:hypothetical protein
MSEPYTLKHPVTSTYNKGQAEERTETIAVVTVRRPKGRDLRLGDAQGGAIANELKLIAQLTDLTIAQVDELDAEDIEGIQKVVAGFSPPGQQTGERS